MSKTFAKNSSYPLEWPDHIPRTPKSKVERNNRFDTTLHKSLGNVQKSLELLAKDSGKKINDITLSANVSLGNMNPDDSGVCVYFNWNGSSLCIPVDRYDRVEHNLQAIYHILEADRTKLRHGGFEFVMAEKQGKTNLLTDGSEKNWRDVLGVSESAGLEEAKKKYRELARQHHSDRGGNDETMAAINKAWEAAKKVLGS